MKIGGKLAKEGLGEATKILAKETAVNAVSYGASLAMEEAGVNPLVALAFYQCGRITYSKGKNLAKGIRNVSDEIDNVKRYNNYWKYVASGKYDIPYGMTKEEYSNYLKGIDKVQYGKVLKNVNYEEILDIRKNDTFTQWINNAEVNKTTAMKEEILKNVEESRIAREASGYKSFIEFKSGLTKGVSKADNLWIKYTCNNDELYNYLLKNVNEDVANKFLKEGKWPGVIQIPKNSSVVNPDGSINWSKAAEGGYTLNADGTAIKHQFNPQIGEVIDRYGNANGRYTSPVIDGKSYSYTERSLPYVEDLSNYHQYEVVGDFTKIKDYVDKCTDIKLKTEIETTVRKYYKGDYSRLVSYKGNAAAVEGWGKGGAIQYEFSLKVEQLQGLGLLKEIK